MRQLNQRNQNNKVGISDDVKIWNARHPIDLWWRRKYNIPFGCKKHLKANFYDMAFDYLEQRYLELEELKKQLKKQNPLGIQESIPMSKEEIDEEFENLDV